MAAGRKAVLGSSRQRARSKHQLITLFLRAQSAQQRGSTSLARSLLQRCLRLDSADAHAALALAQLEADAGYPERARELFLSARAASPANLKLAHAHAVFEARCGRPAAARAAFGACEAIAPGAHYTAHALGQLEESLGRTEAARAAYAHCSDSPTVLAAWAALEARHANVSQARSLYRAACAAAAGGEGVGGEGAGGAQEGEGWPGSSRGGRGEAEAELLREWSSFEERCGNGGRARSLLARAPGDSRAPREQGSASRTLLGACL